ncbi:hypothetical protein [Fructobacillus ficulneus]|uniref:Uncharacterized protein n=1 Tax=Fructobacillus ficulneus TaxID=157463 RepID=A0A0K8MI33_9LACO|nr:hypothetical protein [Fructobacillus ficulneus]GAO99519.1 hypothetical protein FFIC_230030 [Fructobacillus ficulneus]
MKINKKIIAIAAATAIIVGGTSAGAAYKADADGNSFTHLFHQSNNDSQSSKKTTAQKKAAAAKKQAAAQKASEASSTSAAAASSASSASSAAASSSSSAAEASAQAASASSTAAVESSATPAAQPTATASTENTRTDGVNYLGHHFDNPVFYGSGKTPNWTNNVWSWASLSGYYLAEQASVAGQLAQQLTTGDAITVNGTTYHVDAIDQSINRTSGAATVMAQKAQHAIAIQTCNDSVNVKVIFAD